MRKPPKITVILRSYNHARFLRESIDSVLSQTMPDFELIIWDDASQDASWEIINSYDDPRISAFRNERNMRAVWGLNKAIFEHAQAPYIAVHHSDDIWQPIKLERQLAFMESHANIGALFTKAQIIQENGLPVLNPRNPFFSIFDAQNQDRRLWLRHFFFTGNCLCHPSVLARKEVYEQIGGYGYGFAQLGDLHCWVRICMRHQIHLLDEKLVSFRHLDNNKNASAPTPEALVRVKLETYQIQKLYRSLAQSEDLFAVFPEAKQYDANTPISKTFALARCFVDTAPQGASGLIGLEMLSELLQSPHNAQLLAQKHGFTLNDYVKMTGRCDFFPSNTDTTAMNTLQLQGKVLGDLRQCAVLQAREIARLKRVLQQNNISLDQ